MAIGFDTAVIGSISLGMLLVVLGMLLLVGAILWASRVSKVKDLGRVLTVFALVVLIVLTIAMAVKPAQVTVPPGSEPGEFSVLDVSAITGANYSSNSKSFTVPAAVTIGSPAMTPSVMTATFSVQRTDAGATTDIKTVSASASQVKLTDPVSGDSYNAILPTAFGAPDVDWTMMPGNVTASNTLSAQVGLTPYETGSFAVTIHWNVAAFTTSNIQLNDVIYVGSITVGSSVYTIQVLIATLTP